MDNKFLKWTLFILLSFIWGSSFILIKKGMVALDAFQVASLRIISAALILLPLAYRAFKEIPRNKMLVVFLSGVLGSLLPAYLFCIAERELDSALAGTLNALTPIFVIIIGALFFKNKTSAIKIAGIIVAFTGSVLLYFFQPVFSPNNTLYIMYIVAATICYGINVNMVQRHLKDISSSKAVAVALTTNAVPAIIVLYYTGYFSLDLAAPEVLASTGYSFILGMFGTAIASILFYILIKKAGAVFSSMVTYGIPLVANFWGSIHGEKIGLAQIFSLVVILAGVFIANKKSATPPKPALAPPVL